MKGPKKTGLAPFITLPFKLERPLTPFGDDDIRYPEALVRHCLKTYTKPGDKVLDPFAGLGTTLFVAESMKRVPYGVEADRQRYEWVAGQLTHWQQLVHGDAARLDAYDFPKMDFCMTSPPYMPRHHKWNPLFGGNPKKQGYDLYLRRMTQIFKSLRAVMKKNARVIVQADNLHHGNIYTPLVRDLGDAISKVLTPEGETIVAWEGDKTNSVAWQGGKPDYRHTHCLIFKNT